MISVTSAYFLAEIHEAFENGRDGVFPFSRWVGEGSSRLGFSGQVTSSHLKCLPQQFSYDRALFMRSSVALPRPIMELWASSPEPTQLIIEEIHNSAFHACAQLVERMGEGRRTVPLTALFSTRAAGMSRAIDSDLLWFNFEVDKYANPSTFLTFRPEFADQMASMSSSLYREEIIQGLETRLGIKVIQQSQNQDISQER